MTTLYRLVSKRAVCGAVVNEVGTIVEAAPYLTASLRRAGFKPSAPGEFARVKLLGLPGWTIQEVSWWNQ
jgi:hypothetical protein